MLGDGAVVALADGFRRAAYDGRWETPLEALAAACGGRAAQLIGIGGGATVAFNIAHGVDPEGLDAFREMDGANPALNPRVRFGVAAPPLAVMTEADFGPLDRTLKSELYAGLFTPHDIAFGVQAKLLEGRAAVIGLAVMHGRGHGLATEDEKRVFAAVAPAVQSAVRTRIALEADGARLLAGALEAATLAAFVCDATGAVCALTTAAETLAVDQTHLRIVRGRLTTADAASAEALQAAIWRGAQRPRPANAGGQVMLRAPREGPPLMVEVSPLPARDFPLGVEASVLVIARVPRALARLAPLLQQVYGLTPAEAEVCLAMAGGDAIAGIAVERRASEHTIRVQLKHAAAKLGLRRQAEIAAFVNAL